MASSRRSTSVSTRLTKNDATLAIVRDVAAGGVELFETLHVGVDDLAVALEPEQQRDVDVDALTQALPDRRQSLGGARDLHEQVRLVDLLPELAGGRDGAVGVAGELRARPRPTRSRRRRSMPSDNGRRMASASSMSCFTSSQYESSTRAPLLDELAELVVVVGRALDRLGEDRRVRRDAAHASLGPALQLTGGDPSSLEVVEPRALAVLVVQLLQPSHQSSSSSSARS